MEPLLVEVGELLSEHGASIEIRREIDLAPLTANDVVYRPQGPASLAVTLSHAGEGLVATGTIDVDLGTECSRCLQPFVLHVQGDVQGLYVESMDSAWAEQEDAEPIIGGDIDLAVAAESAIRVELPFAPLHDEDCKGICPTCGADLNADSCACDSDPSADGPFSALQSLLHPNDEVAAEGED